MLQTFRLRCKSRSVGRGQHLALAALCLALVGPNLRADQIVLRNFDILDKVTVQSFDEDGVRLADKRVLTWDQIETGTLAKNQAAFDKLLKQLGEPLYRIRQRLKVGDYKGLLSHAEAVYPRYARRSSASAYMVCQALMWARLDAGRREEALEPYFRVYELLRGKKVDPEKLPGRRRLAYDAKTGLTSELTPIWFNEAAAKKALPSVGTTIGQMAKPLPSATRLYYGALSLTAGDRARALEALGKQPLPEPRAEQLRQLLLAQSAVVGKQYPAALKTLQSLTPRLDPLQRPLGLYWLGVTLSAQAGPEQQKRGMLALLRIPAHYGRQRPSLAAAALHRAMDLLNQQRDVRGSIALRRELLQRYGQTYHAMLARSKTALPKKKTNP